MPLTVTRHSHYTEASFYLSQLLEVQIFLFFVLGQACSKIFESFRNNMKTIFFGNILTHMKTLFLEKKFPLLSYHKNLSQQPPKNY